MKIINITGGFEVMVDDEDYEKLNKVKWQVSRRVNNNYAQKSVGSYENKKDIKMHREITNAPDGMLVDHIDGNGLNNTKSNLRIVTHRQNSQNRSTTKKSIYPGVCTHGANRWRAYILVNKVRKHLGNYKTELEAYNAYLTELKNIGEVCITEIPSIATHNKYQQTI
ncbi:HNH endonuclease signature motif containing protein [Clostridium sp.]